MEIVIKNIEHIGDEEVGKVYKYDNVKEAHLEEENRMNYTTIIKLKDGSKKEFSNCIIRVVNNASNIILDSGTELTGDAKMNDRDPGSFWYTKSSGEKYREPIVEAID